MSSCPVYLIKNVAVDQAGIAFELAEQKIFVSWLATGSERLTEAAPTARSLFEIDPDGIGWYWPALDEDLSTSGLLRAAQRADLIQQPQSIFRPESVSETVGQD